MIRMVAAAALLTLTCVANAFADDYCVFGEKKWVEGCEARARTNKGTSRQSCTAAPPPGYVIINHRIEGISHRGNNSHSVSRIAGGQTFDYAEKIEEAFKAAADAAARDGKTDVAANIREEMRQTLSIAERFSSSHQLVRLSVSATGENNPFDRKSASDMDRVHIQIQCIVPANLREQLFLKHALN